jgi:glycosyltransferase involved in cell wall biosynthesis
MAIKITVITATKDCVSTISDCLDSISAQSWQNREHIVVDGCSVDGTFQILFSRKNSISKLISEKDRSVYDALNKGIKNSTGDVIGFLHADDQYVDSLVLERIARAFDDQNLVAVYGDLLYVSNDPRARLVRRWRSKPFSQRDLSLGWMPPHPTLYVRREWYLGCGGFDARLKISADYLNILQLFSEPGIKVLHLPHFLVKMRLGGISNRSIKNIIAKTREDLIAIRLMKMGGVSTLLFKNLRKISQFF